MKFTMVFDMVYRFEIFLNVFLPSHSEKYSPKIFPINFENLHLP